ncbi:MAG: 5-oxoprolinase subunit PxpB [Pseudomonadota bacterium]
MSKLNVVALSERALTVGSLSLDAARSYADHLRESGGWQDVVQGLDSVTVSFDPMQITPNEARARLEGQLQTVAVLRGSMPGELIELYAEYGGEAGPDLEPVAARLGMSAEDVVQRHTSVSYSVAVIGFTPGFAYLSGLDEKLRVPRLSEPRLRVPPGSIAIAGAFTGVYPMSSPGGWSIIGRTTSKLVDPFTDDPFVLSVGQQVRFISSPC